MIRKPSPRGRRCNQSASTSFVLLVWLKNHNHYYSDIIIKKENLDWIGAGDEGDLNTVIDSMEETSEKGDRKKRKICKALGEDVEDSSCIGESAEMDEEDDKGPAPLLVADVVENNEGDDFRTFGVVEEHA